MKPLQATAREQIFIFSPLIWGIKSGENDNNYEKITFESYYTMLFDYGNDYDYEFVQCKNVE